MLRTWFKHSSWNAVATLSHQGSTFASNFLVIHIIDRAAYGKFSLLNLTAFYAASILQLAVGSTVSRFAARFADCDKKLSSVIWICGLYTLASGLLGLALLLLGAGVLARSVFLEPSLVTPLAIISLSIPSLIGIIFLSGLLQGLHSFKKLAISSLISSIFFVAVVSAGAWLHGLDGAIMGFVTGTTIRALAMGAAAVIETRTRKLAIFSRWRAGFDQNMREVILKFQIPAGLAGFITLPTLWLMPTILTRNSQDFTEVASYSVVIMIKSLVVLPASVITLALQPSAEKAWSSGQTKTASRVFRTSLAVSLGIVTIMALFIAIFARQVMAWFGNAYVIASPELQIMMIGAVAEACAVVFYMRVQAASRMWASIFVTLMPRDLIMLTIALMFTTVYGLWAVVVAHVAGALVNAGCVYGLGRSWLPNIQDD